MFIYIWNLDYVLADLSASLSLRTQLPHIIGIWQPAVYLHHSFTITEVLLTPNKLEYSLHIEYGAASANS